MGEDKSSGGSRGSGCLGCLAMIAFFSLLGWAFFDIGTPKEAVQFGFKGAAVWIGAVLVGVLGLFGAIYAYAWWDDRRTARRLRRRGW